MLVEEAAAFLGAGDVRSYRALFARAADIDDLHARYFTRKGLVEAGLAATGDMGRASLAALFLAMATGLVEVLEEESREPVLLNYLGVALFELGSLDPSEKLFVAARRLDPALPAVEANLEEVARRRRTRAAIAPLPPSVTVNLPALARRAERCAEWARPAEGLTLSLCMIVRDEEEMLPRCLEAVRDAVDEIIIVDTGSTDGTIEVARKYGARVFERPWTGSFSEARNAAFDEATGDWMMVLDADEVLVAEDAGKLRELTGRVWREAFYVVETNFTGELEFGTAVKHSTLRVFRNRPEYRYEGRIHEQIAQNLPAYLPERIEGSGVRIEHYGYVATVRDEREKARRNIELLQRQVEEGVETPFLHFNLGAEHLAAGDTETALGHFERSWEMLQDHAEPATYPFVGSLITRLVQAYRVSGDRKAADRHAEEGLRLFPGFTDLVLEQAWAAHEDGDHDRAVELLERCLKMGDAPASYTATVGSGTYLAMCSLAEVRLVRGEVDEAERLLTHCMREHPGYFGAVLPLAVTKLARGSDPALVAHEIEENVAELGPSATFVLGTALEEAAAPVQAEAQFRKVLERQPSSDPARVALARALFLQGRYADAAAAAAEVSDGSPSARAARRAELVARILGGDRVGFARALDRAVASGLHPADIELLSSWQAATQGGPLPDFLPPEAISTLAAILEDLLRLQEIDAFAALVPVLERLPMPWRRRRQLLAGMYMRQGFLESAGDEWVAVIEQNGREVDALLGLAQVALARQMPEDALVMAREILRLMPDHAVAQRIVAKLAA